MQTEEAEMIQFSDLLNTNKHKDYRELSQVKIKTRMTVQTQTSKPNRAQANPNEQAKVQKAVQPN